MLINKNKTKINIKLMKKKTILINKKVNETAKKNKKGLKVNNAL